MPEDARPDSVAFCQYPKLIYVWPLIVLGPLFYFLAAPRYVPDPEAPMIVQQATQEGEPETAKPTMVPVAGENRIMGWVYIVVLFLVILTIGVDVERNYAVFWAVALAAIWLACWLLGEKGIPVFSHVYGFFAGLNASYDRGLGLAVSLFLLPPYLAMMIWAQFNDKWRITHNEFEHYSWGRADDSLARGAKRVRTTYPDVLEFLLCGAGTMIVYSATGRSELRRIHNVPLLFLKRKRINEILERTLVTTDPAARAAIEAEEAEEEESETYEGSEREERL